MDYFSIYISGYQNQSEMLLFRGFGPSGVEAAQWNDDLKQFEEVNTITFPIEGRLEENLVITRFYKGYVDDTLSVSECFWKEKLHFYPLRHLSQKFGQLFFNYKTKFRHDRIALLKRLVAFREKRASQSNTVLFKDEAYLSPTLFSELYGPRVFSHPNQQLEQAKFTFILDSLVESGDLTKEDGTRYKLTPKSLMTLARHEEEERRHSDQVNHNRVISLLTLVIAAATVATLWSGPASQ